MDRLNPIYITTELFVVFVSSCFDAASRLNELNSIWRIPVPIMAVFPISTMVAPFLGMNVVFFRALAATSADEPGCTRLTLIRTIAFYGALIREGLLWELSSSRIHRILLSIKATWIPELPHGALATQSKLKYYELGHRFRWWHHPWRRFGGYNLPLNVTSSTFLSLVKVNFTMKSVSDISTRWVQGRTIPS